MGQLFTACVVGATALAFVRPAGAQVTSKPGEEGSPGRGSERHQFVAAGEVAGAHTNTPAAEVPSLGLSGGEVFGGYSAVFRGTMSYGRQWRKVQFTGAAGSALQYVNQLKAFKSVSHDVALGLTHQLGPRTSAAVEQTFAYSPAYFLDLFGLNVPHEAGVQPAGVAPDYVIEEFKSYSYGTSLRLSRGLGRRSRMAVNGDFRYTDLPGSILRGRDARSGGLAMEFSRNVSGNTAWTASYRFQRGNSGFDSVPGASQGVSASEHGIQGGLTYSRPFSATRRATFSAALGTSAVDTGGISGDGLTADRMYRVAGNASAEVQFKFWQAQGNLRRGLEYIPTLRVPVFTTSWGGSLTAWPARKMNVRVSGQHATGASALARDAVTFDTTSASVRAQLSASRTVGMFGEYVHYLYDFTRTTVLTPGIPQALDRHSVRVGLTLLISSERR